VIRVNLLSVDRERAKRKATFQVGQKLTVACSLIVVVAALAVGWWYWSLNNDSAELDQQIAEAQRETARLRGVIEQVAQFEARRAQLQQRVSLIEELRKGQTGPVHLLDEISRALPENMWLTELTQRSTEISMTGRCTNLTGLSDFVSALEASNLFQRPVEIIDSSVEAAAQDAPELIRFAVRARLAATEPAKAAN
jgi:type IV pilus assembly protein PilN